MRTVLSLILITTHLSLVCKTKMRIFNWVQNKLSAKQETKNSDPGSGSTHYSQTSGAREEEFCDWPEGLLAIGTFGKKEVTEESQSSNDPSQKRLSSHNLPDFTPEEVTELRKKLTKILASKPKIITDGSESGVGDRGNLPLNRFLNCPSSLEVVRTANNGDLSPNTKIILNKARDILADSHNAMKKKSLTFLLKKMFVCASGFGPTPSLRDPMSESRMEKILRTMLQKKINTQNPTPTLSKKYLENKSTGKKRPDDEIDRGWDGYQWVKTDSEYIVLEI